MTNKSRIITISTSPETEKHLVRLSSKLGKNRSQLVRDLINSYSRDSGRLHSQKPQPSQIAQDLSNPNLVLRKYYEYISGLPDKPTQVIGIAVINRKNRVLIGFRKGHDQYVKNLTWTFPTTGFSTLKFNIELTKNTYTETGFQIKIDRLIHARMIPDSPHKPLNIIALYYHCRIISGKSTPGGDFKELKWIPAIDVTQHFTTSVCDEIMNFLGNLH